VGQKTCFLHELLTRLVITENPFQGHFQYMITSSVHISWRREQVFWATKGTGGLQHHKFLIFDGYSILKKFGSVDVKITPDFCS
jgi:hypothetical protein